MATLPPDGMWLVQQVDTADGNEDVVIFHRHTEEEVVRFSPFDADATARAQKTISDTDRLTQEQKAFAHFWSGYFYAHARGARG